ncbi:TetR/AcrR family transcriptional regulator [Burkholderia cenocepacia]|uniref:TetR/AcrR family transcriptional regulator n=1 Tax=Burkholderia cenocepacia TaxID=95486 RepID=UPI000F5874D6|nr:TetR/AcrR family transcriptional regulator [Burkholderia cenocepacia]RQU46037.1 TetR/AcrR family transcriptional regulator [Burkholderia cenocepacia]RQU73641.1 TetR/AcrR family transcriptional regulator [Burkholderia cenocepacia]
MGLELRVEQKPYHHGDLRRVIIETALDTLREQQNWQFTLREIARRANVSHSAPYRHFPDKAALLRELALIGFDRLRDKLQATLDSATDTPVSLLTLGYAYLDFGAQNPDLYRLMFAADAGEPSDIHLDPRTQAPFLLVIDFLERGQREGRIRRRPALGQATACWAHLHGLTMLAIDGRLVPEKVGDHAIDDALTTLLDGLMLDEEQHKRPKRKKA